MRIFIFKSEASPDLRAFGGDLAGACCRVSSVPGMQSAPIAPDRDASVQSVAPRDRNGHQ